MTTRILPIILAAPLFATLAYADDTRTVDIAGISRTYVIHIPSSLAATPAPLVLVLHGGGGNPEAIAENSRMSEKADREKFIVAYPAGVGRQPTAGTWNATHCCAFAMTSHAADVDFIGKVLDDAAKVHAIDPKRIFITGMSNGGMMTYRALGTLADRFAAAGIVAGAMFDDQPKSSRPVPIVIFHGSADPVVPFKGGISPNPTVAPTMNGPFLPVDAAFDFWAKQDGCKGEPAQSSGEGFSKRSFDSCRDGSAVTLYTIRDGGHAWPGGSRNQPANPPVSATDVMWTFFTAHPKP